MQIAPIGINFTQKKKADFGLDNRNIHQQNQKKEQLIRFNYPNIYFINSKNTFAVPFRGTPYELPSRDIKNADDIKQRFTPMIEELIK